MKYLIIPTNKLFYKKWVYKIECHVHKAYSIKYFLREFRTNEANQIADVLLSIKELGDFQTRVEGSHFNIFCNSKVVFDKLVESLSQYIRCVCVPLSDQEKDFLLGNGNRKIIKDRYHKNIYQYRIYLKDSLDRFSRKRFYEWISRYDETKFYISGNSLKWITGNIHYAANPCIYAANSSALSMICLYLGENIKYTEEFILRSSINTPSET